MLKFRCSECLGIILVDQDTASDTATCSLCNTQQLIPDDAMAVSEQAAKKIERIPYGTIPRTPTPSYPFANVLGGFFIVIGLAGAVTFFFLGFTAPPFFIGTISSLGLAATGAILHLLRDIAIDVRRIRDA